MHVLRLNENVLGFYEGRTPGIGDDPAGGWVEDGALSLGICSYALLDGAEAIVYDTHVSVDRAQTIRDELERLGARRIRVVLSHWHLDHIAGTEAFADCEIIANSATAELLAEHRAAIEAGTLDGPPAIAPLVLPTTTFEGRLDLEPAEPARRARRVRDPQPRCDRDPPARPRPAAGRRHARGHGHVRQRARPARAAPRRAGAAAAARRRPDPAQPRQPRRDRARWLRADADRRDASSTSATCWRPPAGRWRRSRACGRSSPISSRRAGSSGSSPTSASTGQPRGRRERSA